jgi:nicotinate phosphoribosyltransferase
MSILSSLYGHSLALLTDLYQLTMAAGAWRLGRHEQEGIFHLSFRTNPFDGGYAVACGLGMLVEHVEAFRFDEGDLAYLAGLTAADGRPLFEPGFLEFLGAFRPEVDIDAVPEGTVVFPHEPLVRVRGTIVAGQLLETAILNIVNFQTLLATKAARICQATGGEPVLEFGLRRAQGIDGSLTASRAAYIGGCSHTSNVLAGKLFGIPVAGTHAHSWIMSFDDEMEAFEAWAEAMPHNCSLLVDTYDTLEGVRKAATIGRRLAERGERLAGIRLDSGDLAYLSIEARRILDEAGLPDVPIVASNDLDEHVITSLKQQDARIAIWGVGTRLATAFDQPAFGGVYKLSACRTPGGVWEDRIKISEQTAKVSTPGMLQIRRGFRRGQAVADMILDELHPPVATPEASAPFIVDPLDPTRRRRLDDVDETVDLLQPIFRAGRRVTEIPSPTEAREHARTELARFHPGVRRFVNPHGYPVGLEAGLSARRTELIIQTRARTRGWDGAADAD